MISIWLPFSVSIVLGVHTYNLHYDLRFFELLLFNWDFRFSFSLNLLYMQVLSRNIRHMTIPDRNQIALFVPFKRACRTYNWKRPTWLFLPFIMINAFDCELSHLRKLESERFKRSLLNLVIRKDEYIFIRFENRFLNVWICNIPNFTFKFCYPIIFDYSIAFCPMILGV